jgi:Holliday junction resolvase RusA-like endonuclease
MKTIRLTLPVPPSGNNRNVGTGRSTRHSEKYKVFLAEVMAACVNGRVEFIEGPIRSDVAIYYHPSREPDCDNILKTVHDALQGWVYSDDGRIVEGSYRKEQDKKNPRIEVEITAVFGALHRTRI